jgi:hypothetical protein
MTESGMSDMDMPLFFCNKKEERRLIRIRLT